MRPLCPLENLFFTPRNPQVWNHCSKANVRILYINFKLLQHSTYVAKNLIIFWTKIDENYTRPSARAQGLGDDMSGLKSSSMNKLLSNMTVFISSLIELTAGSGNWQQLINQMNIFFSKIQSFISSNNSSVSRSSESFLLWYSIYNSASGCGLFLTELYLEGLRGHRLKHGHSVLVSTAGHLINVEKS